LERWKALVVETMGESSPNDDRLRLAEAINSSRIDVFLTPGPPITS
jgi:hypothetical protein